MNGVGILIESAVHKGDGSIMDVDSALQAVRQAAENGQLSDTAVTNLAAWLSESRYEEYRGLIIDQVKNQAWDELDDVFWTVIPFGTGGRRGRMHPFGSNAINDRTIGESAQGLATYIKENVNLDDVLPSCAIAYDTRHRSRHFAELCASIMVANGFKVYMLDDYRATPQLSYLVRMKNCTCGIMVTASHNPPSDNAVKVYWSTGGQILPPHDSGIIDCVMNTDEIHQVDFEAALQNGDVEFCTDELDAAYQSEVIRHGLATDIDLNILYSPLHGVGGPIVSETLTAAGFSNVEVFSAHAEPDGDFPNVPGHVSNPENPAVFEAMIEYAQSHDMDLILATDPDSDRMGCAAPVSNDKSGDWVVFNGNQLSALLTDFVLSKTTNLSENSFVVKTLVTTEMVRRIADSYNVQTNGNLLVGFKWIAGAIDDGGAEHFIYGTEESHGFMVGEYVRDKDGVVACLLMSQLAAELKQQGRTLPEYLESLWWQHGFHLESLTNIYMKGSEGMSQMQSIMNGLRELPPDTIGGLKVVEVRDYLRQTRTASDGTVTPLDGPVGNLVILDLEEEGNYVAARPSGTEPKIKFYTFTYVPAELLADIDLARKDMQSRTTAIHEDLNRLL
tara:strand:- start:10443 stop:12293 length:1851 start_codon:yes stop_codon:yes gene_type:complete